MGTKIQKKRDNKMKYLIKKSTRLGKMIFTQKKKFDFFRIWILIYTFATIWNYQIYKSKEDMDTKKTTQEKEIANLNYHGAYQAPEYLSNAYRIVF